MWISLRLTRFVGGMFIILQLYSVPALFSPEEEENSLFIQRHGCTGIQGVPLQEPFGNRFPLPQKWNPMSRVSALPLPAAELERLKASLSPEYGGLVWEGAGSRILVVRVPRPEPDLVNDIDQAIEYLSPADTENLTAALLVGHTRTMAVPIGPFAELMLRRVQMDHEQAKELRRRITTDTGHLVYRHPGDPRKVLRLGLRVPHESVQQVGDGDTERWADDLGPDLDAGTLAGVRAVYLVAQRDDVRLDAGLFFQDLKARRADMAERRAVASQVAARQASTPPSPRVAYAPLKSASALTEPAPAAAPEGPALPPALAQARRVLAEAGFDVLVRPKTRHAIDLAAERAEGDIRRVLVHAPDRLTVEGARQAIATSRAVGCDLSLVVCSDADEAARKTLVATRVRWLRPDDLADLAL
jgi:hypothetical protein